MNFLFKYFSKRIVIDVHPSQFTFTCAKDNFCFSVPTFVYIANNQAKSQLIAIGEEIPSRHRTEPDIHRINIFDFHESLPPKTTFNRNDFVEAIFEYGIGTLYVKYIVPRLRPIVFILGADRFNDYFTNPRDELKIAAKHGGAKEVIFDKTDL